MTDTTLPLWNAQTGFFNPGQLDVERAQTSHIASLRRALTAPLDDSVRAADAFDHLSRALPSLTPCLDLYRRDQLQIMPWNVSAPVVERLPGRTPTLLTPGGLPLFPYFRNFVMGLAEFHPAGPDFTSVQVEGEIDAVCRGLFQWHLYQMASSMTF